MRTAPWTRATATGDGAAFAAAVSVTESPFTTVTVNGAPLPEKRPIVG